MKRLNKRLGTKFFAVLICALFIGQAAFADGVGIITYVEGRVDVIRPDSSIARPLREEDIVSVGDAIRTKSGSKVEITFDDNTVLRLAENTRADVKDYQLDADYKRKTANITLERGKARAIIAKTATAAEFIVSTPNAQGTVKGSDIFAFYQSGNSGMFVLDGKLSVINVAHPENPVIVPAGNTVLVPTEEIPKAPRPYFDLEKKQHEQDTSVPVRRALTKTDVTLIRGAVVKLSGDVRITQKGAASSHPAGMNEILGEADRIETGSDGMIEIRFDNGNALNLKPNSNVTITRLVFNPKTGEYENLFESTRGRLKGRIENLRGNSKFEVKTPTATCGARGTIMYLDVLSNMTRAFFEGGSGYITSAISGIKKIVAAGENASADSEGNVSDPSYTDEVDRELFGSGWEPGTGVEGYSAPQGAAGGFLYSPVAGAAEHPLLPEPGGLNFFGDLPFPLGAGSGGSTDTGTTTMPGLAIRGSGSFINDPGSSLSVAIGSQSQAALTEPWSGTVPVMLSGIYSNPSAETIWSLDTEGIGIAGGATVGWMGGSWHSWEGALSNIYIDPTGAAGTMFGSMSGSNAGGSFTGTGDLVIVPMSHTDILPENLPVVVTTDANPNWSNFYGAFDNGYIDADVTSERMNIIGAKWGIWEDYYTGHYANISRSAEWQGIAAGRYGQDGYYFSTLEGTDDLSGALAVDVLGAYLDYHTLGAYYGTMLGTYTQDESSNFNAIGLGTFLETALTSSGYMSGLLFSNEEYIGELSGLIGATDPLEPMVSIGSFDSEIDEPFVWVSNGRDGIYSYNPDNDTYTTYDGGAFVGITRGIGRDGSLVGFIRALYIDPDGNAGIFSAYLSGVYSKETAAYLASADIRSAQMAQDIGVSSRDLYDSVWTSAGDGALSGAFVSGGAIEAQEDLGTMSIVNYADNTAQAWGIYGQEFLGMFSGPTGAWSARLGGNDPFGAYYNKEEEGFLSDYGWWIADITNGTWEDGVLSATLNGEYLSYIHMGALSGNILGLYDIEEMTWQAVGAGTWQAEPLTLSGGWGGEGKDGRGIISSLYYNDDGEISWAGEDYGLVGATAPGWWSQASFAFLAMGRYYEYGYSDRYIWNTPVYSYNGPEYKYTTMDGAAFFGFTAGRWDNGVMEGAARALYIDPDGNAGLLKGDVSGNYYPDIKMWRATADLIPTAMGTTQISPDSLIGYNLYQTPFEGSGAGLFGDSGEINALYIEGTSANILDQNWGIWSANFAGTYEGPTGPFRLAAGGSEARENYAYWLGTAYGEWNGGVIRAGFRGIRLEPTGDEGIAGAAITGQAAGNYIEVDENGAGTWQAAGVGEWVEVTELLDPGQLGFDIDDLGNFVSVPITEVYSSVLTGPGSFSAGGVLSGAMDLSLYATSQAALDGIWAALISGSYSGVTGDSWTLGLTNNQDSVTLTGTQWNNNQWVANVSGTASGNNVNGQAAGTYTNPDAAGSGAFSGVGAGTWDTPS